jgi:hypothetical protein
MLAAENYFFKKEKIKMVLQAPENEEIKCKPRLFIYVP